MISPFYGIYKNQKKKKTIVTQSPYTGAYVRARLRDISSIHKRSGLACACTRCTRVECNARVLRGPCDFLFISTLSSHSLAPSSMAPPRSVPGTPTSRPTDSHPKPGGYMWAVRACVRAPPVPDDPLPPARHPVCICCSINPPRTEPWGHSWSRASRHLAENELWRQRSSALCCCCFARSDGGGGGFCAPPNRTCPSNAAASVCKPTRRRRDPDDPDPVSGTAAQTAVGRHDNR